MCKCKFVLVAALLMSANALAATVLVDNFDSYVVGQVDTVTTNWKGTANITIETDPTNPANQAIRLAEGGGTGQQSTYGILSSEASITEGATKTLFLRFLVSNASTDQSLGLTNVDEPLVGGSDWGQFRAQVGITNGKIRARDGSSGMRDLATLTTGEGAQWYNLWVVVNNAADTIQLYMHQNDNAGATEADRLMYNLTQDTFAFRVSTTEGLDRFYWRGQNNSTDRMIWLDDIYVMDGVSLSNPIPEPVSLLTLGLGALALIRRRKA